MTLHQLQKQMAALVRSPKRELRHRLLGSTALLGLTLFGVSSEQALAACVLTAGTNYLCSLPNTASQTVSANNASVTTAPGFSVDTSAGLGTALEISGLGALSYVDTAASTLRTAENGSSSGLRILANGDDGVTPGSVTVNTNGQISGGFIGVRVLNDGSGTTDITTSGLVTAFYNSQTDGRAILVATGVASGNATINAATVTAGQYGITVDYNGVGSVAVNATGAVSGLTGIGILVDNARGTSLNINAAGVFGGVDGIQTYQEGTGATSITATGTVTGLSHHGIRGFNLINATDLTVNAVAVSGGGTGISVENQGTGATSVTATGSVTGTQTYGILAANGTVGISGGVNSNGTVTVVLQSTATDLTVNAAQVTGGVTGIYAYNFGTGLTTVTASGTVTGTTMAGVFGFNEATASDLAVSTAAASGGMYGIVAANAGTGTTQVTATGNVQGGSYGIAALNGQTNMTNIGNGSLGVTLAAGTDLTINAVNVAGGLAGIYAVNAGAGVTSVTATGLVTASAGDGIVALNRVAVGPVTTLTVHAATVTGSVNGINTQNLGYGASSITTSGAVVGGTGTGILAYNADTALTVNAAAVSGGVNGISARNDGLEATSVTATGAVIGGTGYGIYALSRATTVAPVTPTATVHSAAVSGGTDGIYVENASTGATSIIADGMVTGGTTAIRALSSAGQAIAVTLNGGARNASGSAAALVISATGGAATITNNGPLTGVVTLGDLGNSVTNNATWTTSGANQFGAGANNLVNEQHASIAAAASGAQIELTQFNGLGNFINRGVFALIDGGAGDRATASGNARFEAGSIYAVDVNGAGQSDRLTTGGTVTLVAGSTLAVNVQNGLRFGNRYTVLTANGGLTGTFSSVTGINSTAFLTVHDTYDANNAYLDVTRYRNFADAGLTPNQISTGRALDTIPAGSLFNAVAGLTTEAQARAAFDSLSGEVHASVQTALIEESHFIRDAAIDRIRQGFEAVGAPSMPVTSFAPDIAATSPAANAMAYAMSTKAALVRAPEARLAMWGQGFGSWGHTGGDGNAARLNRSTGGVISGFDGVIAETWRLGVMAGYSHTRLDVRDRASSGQSDNYHVGVYGGTQWGALGFRAGANFTWHDITTARSVAFPGLAENLKADHNAGTTQVFGELGYRVGVSRVALEPFANLAYVNLSTARFTEQGGVAALTSAGANADTAFTTLGLRASTGFMLGAVYATAHGTLGWRHAFSDTPSSTFAFAGGSAFNIAGVPIAREAALINAGMDLAITRAATVGIAYSGQFGTNAADQSVRGMLTVRF